MRKINWSCEVGASSQRYRQLLLTPAVLCLAAWLLAGCGSPFSEDQVGAGEHLVSDRLYAVVVPEGAEQTGNYPDLMSFTWSAAGGRITASIEQVDKIVLRQSGDLTRTPVTVAGMQTQRVDADLRGPAGGESGDRIRYDVAVRQLALPSKSRPTEIDIQLMAPETVSDADIQAFRDTAQRFLDRVQIR